MGDRMDHSITAPFCSFPLQHLAMPEPGHWPRRTTGLTQHGPAEAGAGGGKRSCRNSSLSRARPEAQTTHQAGVSSCHSRALLQNRCTCLAGPAKLTRERLSLGCVLPVTVRRC
ncbi:unnamed protein product [Eretmochelys imbricata]